MKKRFILGILLSVSAMFGFSQDMDAQRLIPGQNVISFSGVGYRQAGGEISWGRCFLSGKSIFGLDGLITGDEVDNLFIPVDESDSERVKKEYLNRSMDILMSGGYLWRVVGTRNRMFNLWLGLTFDMGVRTHRDKYPDMQVPKVKFIYGFTPRLDLELFISKSVSLNAHVHPRLQLYGHRHQERIFYPELGGGLSFYFF